MKTKKLILIKFTLIFSAIFVFAFVSLMVKNKTNEQPLDLVKEDENIITEQPQEDEDLIFVNIHQPLEFPGGEQALRIFINENLRFPIEATEVDVQDRVVVQFWVEKTGKISNIEVVRSPHPAFDKEAIKVIELMPDWTPGELFNMTTNQWEIVRMKMILPINFRPH